MAFEFKDGTFGPTRPVDDSFLQDMLDHATEDWLKAIHFGTPAEIEEVKNREKINEKVAELASRIEEIEAKAKCSTFLHVPDKNEVAIYGRDTKKPEG